MFYHQFFLSSNTSSCLPLRDCRISTVFPNGAARCIPRMAPAFPPKHEHGSLGRTNPHDGTRTRAIHPQPHRQRLRRLQGAKGKVRREAAVHLLLAETETSRLPLLAPAPETDSSGAEITTAIRRSVEGEVDQGCHSGDASCTGNSCTDCRPGQRTRHYPSAH